MIFRLTTKLAKKIKESPESAAPLDGNPFIDWAATLFTINRHQYILITNRESLLSWVFYGSGVPEGHQFILKALTGIRECMEEYGFEFIYETQIVPNTGRIRFSKVGDRKVNGVMVDLVKHAQYYNRMEDLVPCEIAMRLNKIPQCSRKNPWPIDAFGKMLIKTEETLN